MQWHSLDRAQQARYYEMAKRERLLHKQLFPGWTARDNYSVIVRRVKRKAAMTQRSIQRTNNNDQGSSTDTIITGSTVVLTCCKGDSQSQWETPIFGPSQLGNPLTDFAKI